MGCVRGARSPDVCVRRISSESRKSRHRPRERRGDDDIPSSGHNISNVDPTGVDLYLPSRQSDIDVAGDYHDDRRTMPFNSARIPGPTAP
jgi:hypothetical protein